MNKRIADIVKKAITDLGLPEVDFNVEFPADMNHGDYSTNVAMVLASSEKTLPREIAQKIKDKIEESKPVEIEKLEIAGAGFINFYLTDKFFEIQIKNILEQKENFGRNNLYNGKTILVEHSSPNLFKPFHVGHVMNNAIGESIARLAEFSGAKVIRMSYPSDVSLGIGKAVWSLLKKGTPELLKLETESKKLKFLGECYVDGTKSYDENEEIQKQVKRITEIIYKKIDSIEYDAYLQGKEITLSYFLSITKRLGSVFDNFIYESEAGKVGEKIVRERTGDVFEESEGAIVYKGEQDGLHTRVFINKEGYPTYEAKDIGLLFLKFDRFDLDKSILVTDHEQSEYYKVVLSAAEKINSKWKEKSIHRTHGRMSFNGAKMSSRLGGIPTAADILEVITGEAKNKIVPYGEKISSNSSIALSEEELNKHRNLDSVKDKAEIIAIAALKFTILKTMAGKDINFDQERSLSFEGDTGPYLQYTASRISSVMEKALDSGVNFSYSKAENNVIDVERLVCRFPEFVAVAVKEWSPHHIAIYLLDLSRSFNSWYGNTKIIDSENINMSYNLAITCAVGEVIKNGLHLLGIKIPSKM